MTKYRTSTCAEFGHNEISFTLNSDAGIEAQSLVEYFEKAVRTGQRFQAGETVQIGWMVVSIRANAEGDLELWEPQFDSVPIRWTKGVDNTFRHLIIQKSVCELFALEPDFPSLRSAGIVSADFLQNTDGFAMTRDRPTNNDSGWIFRGANEPTSVSAQFRSLFEVSFYQTNIIPFLALPVGANVTKVGGVIQANAAGKSISSKESELLRKLSESPILV